MKKSYVQKLHYYYKIPEKYIINFFYEEKNFNIIFYSVHCNNYIKINIMCYLFC